MNKIYDIRIYEGLSQAGLAEKVGTSQQQIDRWEKGQSVSIDDAVALAVALNRPLEDVFPVAKKLAKDEYRAVCEYLATERDPNVYKAMHMAMAAFGQIKPLAQDACRSQKGTE